MVLCRYASPRELLLSKQSMFELRNEDGRNVTLERYISSFTALNLSHSDILYRNKKLAESSFIAKAFSAGLPVIAIGPKLFAFMFTKAGIGKFLEIKV